MQENEVASLRSDQLVVLVPSKLQTESMKFCKKIEEGFIPNKRTLAGSMRVVAKRNLDEIQLLSSLASEFKADLAPSDELAALKSENRKLRLNYGEEQSRRRQLEEEILLSRQEVKRLEMRLKKYRAEREAMQEEQESLRRHI
jgi:chromosome segregation ATPase